ncbi:MULTISPECIES: hypothetical protein [Novosphingobium]|nr:MULTISPECIES: hypothetical protein [Novosphingobium]
MGFDLRSIGFLCLLILLFDAAFAITSGWTLSAVIAFLWLAAAVLLGWKEAKDFAATWWRIVTVPLAALVTGIGSRGIYPGGWDWFPVAAALLLVTGMTLFFRVCFWAWCAAFLLLWAASIAFVGLEVGAVFAALLTLFAVMTNFAAKFVMDHAFDLNRIRTWRAELKDADKKTYRQQLTGLLIPVFVLAAIGFGFNYWLQARIVDYIYASGLVYPDPESNGLARDLEADAFASLDLREALALADIKVRGDGARAKGGRIFTKAQERVLALFGGFSPTPLDSEATCKSWNKQQRITLPGSRARQFLGGGRHGHKRYKYKMIGPDLTKDCEALGKALDARDLRDHEKGMTGATAIVEQSGDDASAALDAGVGKAELKAETLVRYSFWEARIALDSAFVVLRMLAILSWIVVACSVLAAVCYVAGRVSFDRTVLPFSLRGRPARSSPAGEPDSPGSLDMLPLDRLELDTVRQVGEKDETGVVTKAVRQEKCWYLCFDAARYGDGTHMRWTIPSPGSAFFRRLFAAKLAMTKVELAEIIQHKPTIAVAGDLKLLDIVVDEGREIVFRMKDLIAFSKGVRIRSIYSTHVGTELFGLTSFYNVASGTGRLVLKTEGREVFLAPPDVSIPPNLLVAWDHSATFALAQDSGIVGVWGNAPSVMPTLSGTAIVDESRPGDPGIFGRIWRLLRFAVLPV